jgi:hypothetical protein
MLADPVALRAADGPHIADSGIGRDDDVLRRRKAGDQKQDRYSDMAFHLRYL